jgi:hypothetical protein
MAKLTLSELKKATEVLNSRHVGQVDASFEYEADGIRYYTAISHKGFEQHFYSVRVQDWEEAGEIRRFIKCNCASGAKEVLCRHAIAVGKVDSEMFGGEMFMEALLPYKAHLPMEPKKCSVCDEREAVIETKCRQCAQDTAPYLKNTTEVKRLKIGNVFV